MTKKMFVLLMCTIFFVGCSTKVSYFFLDWAIEWEVEEYVDLNREQQDKFDLVVEDFLVWHRQEELPRYRDQLQLLSIQANQHTLTPALWQQQVKMAKAHWYRIFNVVMPELLQIIASFDDTQVQQVLTQLKKEQKDLIEEYAGKDQTELVQDSDKRIEKSVKEWTGNVTDTQKKIIHQANSERLTTLDMWLEYRHEWLRQFEQALLRRSENDYFVQQMTQLMTAPDELKSTVYRDKLDENTHKFGAMLIELNESFSEKQRKHFNRKLSELVDDLTELHLDK
ncbi:DUF6279 family lipoprotein [Shewanella sp. A14]